MGLPVQTPNKQKQTVPAIHYVMWRFDRGGMELSVLAYLDHWERDYSLHAYGIRATDPAFYDPARMGVAHGGQSDKRTSYLQAWRYFRRHRKHTFHLLNTGPLIVLLALLAGVKRPIYHIHGTVHGKSAIGKALIRFTWRLANLFPITFVANSRHSAGLFRQKALATNPQVIYNGFEVDRFFQLRHRRTTLRRLAYVGRLHAGKNVELVMSLFDKVAARYPEMELHIAGVGPREPALRQQAAGSPFAARIIFHGFVDDPATFFAEADLMLFLSDHESFGNVIAEALLTGLPVLSSHLSVFEEIYGHDSPFVLGDPNEPAQLANRLQAALENFPALAEAAWAIAPTIRDKFSLEGHLEQIARLYPTHS